MKLDESGKKVDMDQNERLEEMRTATIKFPAKCTYGEMKTVTLNDATEVGSETWEFLKHQLNSKGRDKENRKAWFRSLSAEDKEIATALMNAQNA